VLSFEQSAKVRIDTVRVLSFEQFVKVRMDIVRVLDWTTQAVGQQHTSAECRRNCQVRINAARVLGVESAARHLNGLGEVHGLASLPTPQEELRFFFSR